jgi:hypothetical protein
VALHTIFHGSQEQSYELSVAIKHNCTCGTSRVCGPHQAILEQRFLDGLLFARYLLRRQLQGEEEGQSRFPREESRP